jgi:hypothetical protein
VTSPAIVECLGQAGHVDGIALVGDLQDDMAQADAAALGPECATQAAI